MHLVASGVSDVGTRRDNNEDAFFAEAELGLFIVCDGVGGAQAGEVASAMTTEQVVEARRVLAPELERTGKPGEQPVLDALLELLRTSVGQASESIFARAVGDSSMAGMSTTTVMLAVSGRRAAVGHVGDSRVYLLRSGKLYQLTEDHSLAWELFRKGVLNADELATFRYRNVIVRAVGQHPTVDVDTSVVEVIPGDVFLLCSDGLSDQVSNETIASVLSDTSPEQAAARLVTLANEAGGKDNVTVVVVRAVGEAPSEPMMATEEKALALGGFFLFRDLSFPQTIRILKVVQEVRLDDGEHVIAEGEIGGELFLVVEGRLSVTRDGVELNELGPGSHFGELALISDQVRSATVTAVEPSVLLRIARQDFLDVLHEDPVLATRLLWRFLQETSSRIKILSANYAEAVKGARSGGS